ncbi:ABC transporter substrate-binding protein [Anaerocolumna sp. MB42-C2]|uniref:ABC transporter substrate-binding protein n=1 Tax=Anaerocolumna sp. MB42-C2 TaxID=3070997 RepID=UPI0027E064F3|nr:extracellular solute-binding protein [Anaerocolumna sp. MB42-C2]WMJ85704.1 extracellular solute-binding protein [Anaerocolumna sp. MB42-C2]
MRKKVIASLLAGIMVMSLVACSSSSTKTTDNTNTASSNNSSNSQSESLEAASDKEVITIKVASRYGSDVPDEKYYRDKVEEFNKQNKGIKVEMDNIPTESDYLDKLRTSFANGDTPNVFIEYGGSRVLDYVESDALVDMQPYFRSDPDWYSSFYESMFGDLQYDGYDGIWGVPFKSYTVSLFYNKEIFDQQGLAVPTSWDELMNVCKKLKDAGIKPFQAGEKDVWRLGHLHNNLVIKSLGTDAVAKLADRSLAYDSPEMIKTYQLISDLVSNGYLGDDILNTDYNTEKSTYAAGDCAMRWDGSWYVSEIYGTDIYDKTGVAPFPYIDEKYKDQAQGGASDMWFVSKLNKSEEEIKASIEFVKYITSQEYTAGNNEVASVIYPIKFTPTDKTPANPMLDEIKGFVEGYTAMKSDIQNSDPESFMLDTVRNALQGLAMGNAPEQCGKEIVDRIAEGSE